MAEFDPKQYLDYPGLQDYDQRIKNWVKQLNIDTSDELIEKIEALEELVGDEAVDERISEAIAKVIDGAPETFDTLKEIAEWIETHGEAAAALIQAVAEQGEKLIEVDRKIDVVYNSIQSISGTYIEALFLNPVEYDASKTVAEQIAALGADDKLVISVPSVAEDITIDNDCVIEASGVEFTGKITVAKDKSVTVIGATFSGEVVVQ